MFTKYPWFVTFDSGIFSTVSQHYTNNGVWIWLVIEVSIREIGYDTVLFDQHDLVAWNQGNQSLLELVSVSVWYFKMHKII